MIVHCVFLKQYESNYIYMNYIPQSYRTMLKRQKSIIGDISRLALEFKWLVIYHNYAGSQQNLCCEPRLLKQAMIVLRSLFYEPSATSNINNNLFFFIQNLHAKNTEFIVYIWLVMMTTMFLKQ